MVKRGIGVFLGLCIFFVSAAAGQAASSVIVNPNQVYTYEMMSRDIQRLAAAYPELISYHSIGKSEFGREIWAMKLGKGEATVFLNGSHHAREWLTTNLLMHMTEQYVKAYVNNTSFEGYPTREILNKVTIWFVPMLNPDGVTLQQKGLSAFPKSVHAGLISMNGGSTNFKRWKANGKGVDLNRQYPAYWATIQASAPAPSYMNYKGKAPIVASETKAIVAFTKKISPEIAVSYHSSGRILFWNFHTKPQNLARDAQLANKMSAITGYRLVKPTPNPSGGGYTDWFIQTYGRPAFTPEISYAVGETNPPLSVYGEEWRRNKKVGLFVANEGYKLWYQRNKAVIEERVRQQQEERKNIRNEISRLEDGLSSPDINQEEQFIKIGKLYEKIGNMTPQVYVDGKKLSSDTDSIIQNERTLVPLRAISEILEAEVEWVGDRREVHITKEGGTVVVPVGKNTLFINGKPVILDTSATIRSNRVLVPLRAISESFNVPVKWQPAGRLVIIERPVPIMDEQKEQTQEDTSQSETEVLQHTPENQAPKELQDIQSIEESEQMEKPEEGFSTSEEETISSEKQQGKTETSN